MRVIMLSSSKLVFSPIFSTVQIFLDLSKWSCRPSISLGDLCRMVSLHSAFYRFSEHPLRFELIVLFRWHCFPQLFISLFGFIMEPSQPPYTCTPSVSDNCYGQFRGDLRANCFQSSAVFLVRCIGVGVAGVFEKPLGSIRLISRRSAAVDRRRQAVFGDFHVLYCTFSPCSLLFFWFTIYLNSH